jgi:hypothetical protein
MKQFLYRQEETSDVKHFTVSAICNSAYSPPVSRGAVTWSFVIFKNAVVIQALSSSCTFTLWFYNWTFTQPHKKKKSKIRRLRTPYNWSSSSYQLPKEIHIQTAAGNVRK